MLGRDFDPKGSSLSVVVRAGGVRCVIEARAVARLEPWARTPSGDDEAEPLPLAALLEIEEANAPSVVVRLAGRRSALGVDEVETVRDLKSARFTRLPALTRLRRPIFRGVYQIEGELLPALDLDVLLGGGDGP